MLVKHKITGQLRSIGQRQLDEYQRKGYAPLPAEPEPKAAKVTKAAKKE